MRKQVWAVNSGLRFILRQKALQNAGCILLNFLQFYRLKVAN
jgi:hypothetical protein